MFVVTGLDPQPFAKYFALSDEELAERHIKRVTADQEVGFPCRISLNDAPIGSTLLLMNYEHQSANSPYQASHAIYVSEHATRSEVRDAIPPALHRRMLSLRAFDSEGMMTDAALVKGEDAVPEIERLLASDQTAYIHAHYAIRGCFAATITRDLQPA